MLAEARLPLSFWAEGLSAAVYLRNWCPPMAVKGMTQLKAWTGEKPTVEHLRVAKADRRELDVKSIFFLFFIFLFKETHANYLHCSYSTYNTTLNTYSTYNTTLNTYTTYNTTLNTYSTYNTTLNTYSTYNTIQYETIQYLCYLPC